ncbi:MAG: S8 family serine peptidase, partial [Deltaproteobacteria bacterium]|nr:S8 family serine peptidase [Deltaproteobacteria bacterium]
FFRADGGRYDWADLDGDGVFTPGADGVDLDGDSTVGQDELLQVLEGPMVWTAYSTRTMREENVYDGFDPDQDWLWLDLNGTGTREVGPGPGFAEATPGFGEPVFVADDVDGSGTLDPGERLLRLGTSKIRKIYRPGAGEAVWTRGVDLITYPAWGSDISHATMTAGVAAGNLPMVQRRHGVAPGADILLVDWESDQMPGEEENPYGDPVLAGLVWLVDEGADVTSHSYGILDGEYCDGSSELELAMDYIFENSGVPACVSAGNEGDYAFHGRVEIPPDDLVRIPVVLGAGGLRTWMARFNLRWNDGLEPFTFAIEDPDGNQAEISDGPSESLPLGTLVTVRSSGRDVSDRGTSLLTGRLRREGSSWQSPKALPSGEYGLLVRNEASESRILDVIFSDWFNPDSIVLPTAASSFGTITWPSTSDTALCTGASVSNEGGAGARIPGGILAGYSSRGPRIDGELGIDLVAPCDLAAPWVGYSKTWLDAMGAPPEYYQLLDPYYPMYHSASGTSGAAPFAAGL